VRASSSVVIAATRRHSATLHGLLIIALLVWGVLLPLQLVSAFE